jgi:hypothetical protein
MGAGFVSMGTRTARLLSATLLDKAGAIGAFVTERELHNGQSNLP